MVNVEKLETICQKIIQLDPKVRSARIINNRGHLEAGGMKDGLVSLEDQKQDEMLFMELALRVRMRHEFDKEFGEVNFSLSYRDRVVIMSFPLENDDVLLVSTEKDIHLDKVPFDILKIIKPLKHKITTTF
ncbi:MAG: DUF6659 family protein [Nitrosopumilaceae archaeon]|nr:DUF6659 family protein [Nitrosopumilaceae archaeon]